VCGYCCGDNASRPGHFYLSSKYFKFFIRAPVTAKKNTSKNFNAPKLDYGRQQRRRANCRQQVRAPSVPSASELCNPERQIAYLETLQALARPGWNFLSRSASRERARF
jgi:hypothetical protein